MPVAAFSWHSLNTFPIETLDSPCPLYCPSPKSYSLTLCTLDGIQVNDELQPIGENGEPIEGVYIVGNDQGCFYAGTYPNQAAGLNAGRCATFGRMVSKKLATT